MEQLTVRIAGLTITIRHRYDDLPATAADYLTDDTQADVEVTVTPEDIEAERAKVAAEAILEGIPCPNYTDARLETTATFRKIADRMPEFDGLVLHGSAVAVGDRCYIFTAKSGVGKTTHSLLWKRNIPGSYILNGDKPILRRCGDRMMVCGTPWYGKEKYGRNACLPLDAICLLSRGEKNRIERISFAEAFPALVEQTYRCPDRAAAAKTLHLLSGLGKETRFFRLSCNMEDDAAITAYEGMVR